MGYSKAIDAQPCETHSSPAEALRAAMRSYVTGVTIVTSRTEAGDIAGMTANSFTSVSLDPPLVLVCLSSTSRSFKAMEQSGQIAIHILADDQSGLARAFASQGIDRGSICRWTTSPRGNAILESYLTVLECTIHDIQPAGDHAIVIARVESIDHRRQEASPLVYHAGRLFSLAQPAP